MDRLGRSSFRRYCTLFHGLYVRRASFALASIPPVEWKQRVNLRFTRKVPRELTKVNLDILRNRIRHSSMVRPSGDADAAP